MSGPESRLSDGCVCSCLCNCSNANAHASQLASVMILWMLRNNQCTALADAEETEQLVFDRESKSSLDFSVTMLIDHIVQCRSLLSLWLSLKSEPS